MRDLNRLLAPSRIAVIGGGAWGDAIAGAAERIGFAGEIIAVHPSGKPLAGRVSVQSVREIPGRVDAAFVCVNRRATIDVVADLSAAGCGGAVCFASGFAEAAEEDAEARALQAALVAAADNMAVLGPNCYGFVNGLDRAAIWPDQHGMLPIDRGVAILTQSSNIAINLTMQNRAVPIAMTITCGNMAQTSQAEIARHLLSDRRITAIGLHIEGFGDLRDWEAFAKEAWAQDVPVVALKVGASEAARAATQSHTASLAGSDAGAAALLARLGIARAQSVADFLETLKIFHSAGRLSTASLTSISCSGGEASLVADRAEAAGLVCPPLTTDQETALRDVLGPMVALANPLDYHTYIWRDVDAMGRAWTAAACGKAAITISVVDYPRTDARDWRCATEAAKRAAAGAEAPFAVVSSLPELMPQDVAAELSQAGVIPMNGLSDALAAIRVAASTDPPEVTPVALPGAHREAGLLAEDAAKRELQRFGVAVPTETAFDGGDFDARARYVVKGLGLAHKSEEGAVHLNVPGDKVDAVAREMNTDTVLVEEMIGDGVAEVLVGIVRDPAHGFVLTLGAGGVLTEILQDTRSLLVPAPRASIRQALQALRIWPILQGYRGKPGADIEAVLEAVEGLQAYVLANLDRVEEIEVNPLIATPTRAVAADALIRKVL